MRLWPYERYTAEFRLPPQELSRRLGTLIDPPKSFRWPWDPSNKPFEGKMDGNQFKLMTLLKFQRDSFRPVVIGGIEPGPQGSILRAVLRLHWSVAIFMAIWIAVPLMVSLISATHLLASGRLGLEPLGPVLFALVGYLFCVTFFWLGSRRVKRVLRGLAGE
jgi:hypothetical protein